MLSGSIRSEAKENEKKEHRMSKERASNSLANFMKPEVAKHFQEISIISWVNSLCMMLSYQQGNSESLFFAFETSLLLEKHINHIFEDSVKEGLDKWNKWLKERCYTHELTDSDINKFKKDLVESVLKRAREKIDEEMREQKKCDSNISRIYPGLFFKKEQSIKENFNRILLTLHPDAASFSFKPFSNPILSIEAKYDIQTKMGFRDGSLKQSVNPEKFQDLFNIIKSIFEDAVSYTAKINLTGIISQGESINEQFDNFDSFEKYVIGKSLIHHAPRLDC